MADYLFLKFMDVNLDTTAKEGVEYITLLVNQMLKLENQPDDHYHYWYMVGEYAINLDK